MQAALEQRPEVLDPVGMDISTDVLFGVVNDFVNVVLSETGVRTPFIGKQFGTFLHVGKNLCVKSSLVALSNDLSLDNTVALHHSHDYSLANCTAFLKIHTALFGQVHVPSFAANACRHWSHPAKPNECDAA